MYDDYDVMNFKRQQNSIEIFVEAVLKFRRGECDGWLLRAATEATEAKAFRGL